MSAGVINKKRILNLVCDAIKPQSPSMQSLLDRIRRNEASYQSTLALATNIWKGNRQVFTGPHTYNDEPSLLNSRRIFRRKRFGHNKRNSNNTEGKEINNFMVREIFLKY